MIRRTLVLVFLISSLSAVTLAQQNQVALFLSQSQEERSNRSYGLSFQRQWVPRFSTGLAVAMEDPVVRSCSGGWKSPRVCREAMLRTYPIDLTGRFHFVNDTRFKPFVGAGVRYVAAPDLTSEELTIIGQRYSDHLDPQVVGGLEFRISDSFTVGLEMKALFRNDEVLEYDSFLKITGGVGWRF
ncbi:MAG: hypothetical protein WA208_04350 [Thermoanaerobaculia bacterium]